MERIRSLNVFIALPVLFLMCLFCEDALGRQAPKEPAEWTVMVYMNGDNNLKPYALKNFAQIARAGSTDKVNVVVQFDSIAKYDFTPPIWSQTLRFYIRPASTPAALTRAVPSDSVSIVDGGINEEADMGSGRTLSAFVEWATTKYRAKKYALIIWDHGQGYRADPNAAVQGFRSATLSPYRTVSNDETNKSQLYVRDVQDSLESTLLKLTNRGVLPQPKLDVIGFDACLMAMVETSYALRHAGVVMVGSQDLEPGYGWQYEDWLKQLGTHPQVEASGLGSIIVESYRRAYGIPDSPSSDPETTLSAVDLAKVDILAKSISQLSDALVAQLATQYLVVQAARAHTPVYAPNAYRDGKEYFYHIDLGHFVDELQARSSNAAITQAAASVKAALLASVIDTYAGTARIPYGSTGLCIYFPANKALYEGDVFSENGYERGNTKWPVAFVDDQSWTDFLHAYYEKEK